MLIWILMGIFLVVIVLGGFVGRARQNRSREEVAAHEGSPHAGQHHTSHHGKNARKSRGRGRH